MDHDPTSQHNNPSKRCDSSDDFCDKPARFIFAMAWVMPMALFASVASDPGCPTAPPTYTAAPGHCINFPGPDARSQPAQLHANCAGAPLQLTHGFCPTNMTHLGACVGFVAGLCNAASQCHSIALEASGSTCSTAAPKGFHYQLFTLGTGGVVANNQWIAYTKAGGPPIPPPSPPAPPAPPAPPHSPPVPKESDCAIRRLALEYSASLLGLGSPLPEVFDGLELGVRCNDTRPTAHRTTRPTRTPADAASSVGGGSTVYVDCGKGRDANPGTLSSPVATVAAGLALLRQRAGARAIGAAEGEKVLVLRAGTCYLSAPIVMTPADSNMHIRGYEGDGDELPWISGALPLVGVQWKKVRGNASVYEADVSESIRATLAAAAEAAEVHPAPGGPLTEQTVLAALHSLRYNGVRATAARWPNARIELDMFPVGYQAHGAWQPLLRFAAVCWGVGCHTFRAGNSLPVMPLCPPSPLCMV